MNKFIVLVLVLMSFGATAQNVGINNTDPNLSLDITGGFGTRAVIGIPYLNTYNLPDNVSFVEIQTDGNVNDNVTIYPSPYVDGRRVVIKNICGFPATFGSTIINSLETKEFICRNPGGWSEITTGESSQVTHVTEGGKSGWRLLNEDPADHGNIGQKAMDLSVSTLGANSIYGATGDYAVALGKDVISEGESAIAIGKDVKANGLAATSLGSGNEVNGDYSTALGNDNVINTSNGAVAIGSINELNNANNSMALGSANIVNANAASAIGESNTVSGIAATAIGSNNNTEGDYAASIGFANAAIGNNSLAIGNSNAASNENAIAMGNESEALGVTTTAMGSSWASSLLSVSIGRYSDTIVGSNRSTWVDTDPLLTLGNGSSYTNLKNAMTVYKNGTLQLENHTTTPANSTDKFYVLNNEPYFGTQKIQTSQLEKITEGGNTGWRLAGRDPNNYGNIGIGAIDFSHFAFPSIDRGATGEKSVALGVGTKATHFASTAIGDNTTASAFAAIAMGHNTIASGERSTAMGWQTTASGSGSIAMGWGTISNNEASTAMGRQTTASGLNSTAMGFGSTASGATSLAANSSIASGLRSASFNQSIALGENSFATGNGYVGSTGTNAAGIAGGGAFGINASALGEGTRTWSFSSTSLGRYNDGFQSTSSTNTWVNTDPLFIIGNGTSDTDRKNAMTVYKNANTEISGYTRLGLASEGAPIIKTKKIINTSHADHNGEQPISHGLTASKILSVSVLIEWNTNQFAPPAYSQSANLLYNYYINDANIVIRNDTPSGNCLICNKAVKLLITYEE